MGFTPQEFKLHAEAHRKAKNSATAKWFRNHTPPTEREEKLIRDQLWRDMTLDRQQRPKP